MSAQLSAMTVSRCNLNQGVCSSTFYFFTSDERWSVNPTRAVSEETPLPAHSLHHPGLQRRNSIKLSTGKFNQRFRSLQSGFGQLNQISRINQINQEGFSKVCRHDVVGSNWFHQLDRPDWSKRADLQRSFASNRIDSSDQVWSDGLYLSPEIRDAAKANGCQRTLSRGVVGVVLIFFPSLGRKNGLNSNSNDR